MQRDGLHVCPLPNAVRHNNIMHYIRNVNYINVTANHSNSRVILLVSIVDGINKVVM